MGDWNVDIKHDLDSQNVSFTYRNCDYKICNNNDNSSDHLPITIKVDVDLGVKNEINHVIKKFHRFDWRSSAVVDKYNEKLEKFVP
ncbi:unnamed protein product [Brachionus calyciflorus]|uniref:Uncharacterized protein n=1 Tax=Brachionus calyciflorus TaxID=104777 RepID=A0A813SJZ9_9BILA|nr:unnamed protein product [Brachionus calyciflorus]